MALSQDEILALPTELRRVFRQMEVDVITRIARHIGEIGTVTPSDLHRMSELQMVGYRVDEIIREVQAVVGDSRAVIDSIFAMAAIREYEAARITYDLKGVTWVPFERNERLKRLTKSISTVTFGTFKNLSDSRAIGFVDRNNRFMDLRSFYHSSVDDAVIRIKLGQEGFHAAMRPTLRNLADRGLVSLEWETGYKQTFDAAVRRNMLGGLAKLSMEQAMMVGDDIGSDGMEVTYHKGHRPSHDFGGLQFTLKIFKRDIEPKLQEANCYHRAFPIVWGISPPSYTKEELDNLKSEEQQKKEFEGKLYTQYDAEQMQRRFERGIRKYNSRLKVYEAAGDVEGVLNSESRLSIIRHKYNEFSNAMGLSPKTERLFVP